MTENEVREGLGVYAPSELPKFEADMRSSRSEPERHASLLGGWEVCLKLHQRPTALLEIQQIMEVREMFPDMETHIEAGKRVTKV
ncbi:hypothetical protein AN220_00530, partial [Streptomyces nanshensis]